MQQEVYDSIQVLTTDNIRDSVLQTDFSIGTIIPLAPGETVYSSYILTKDSLSAAIYSEPRISGLPLKSDSVNNDFCFGILAFSLVLLALITVFGRRNIGAAFSSLSFRHQAEEVSRSASYSLSWTSLLSFIFTILNTGLFITVAMVVTGLSTSDTGMTMVKVTLISCGVFTGLVLLRHFTCIIVAAFSGQKGLFMEYMSIIYTTWFILSLVFFGLSIIVLFTSIKEPLLLVWIAGGVAGLLIIIRIMRLLNIFLKRRVPLLYFILYLCALEVLPVLIIIKALGVF